MEIGYSNFTIDSKIYGNNEICGLVDLKSNFIYNNFYDVKDVKYDKNSYIFMIYGFLLNKKIKTFIKKGFESLGLSETIKFRKIKSLSTSELYKLLIIKLLVSSAKVVFFNNIDGILIEKDIKNIIKFIKDNKNLINKTIIFSTDDINLIVENCERFIIADNNNIIYNGTDLKKIPLKTDIVEFVDLANERGAKLEYYKDINDLLKAIYRSVKK